MWYTQCTYYNTECCSVRNILVTFWFGVHSEILLLFTVSYCPEGWFGNPYLPYCFFVSNERRTYAGSEAACRNYGGTLAPIGSEFNNGMAQSAILYSQDIPSSGDGECKAIFLLFGLLICNVTFDVLC